jgi:hypothetical protein
VSAQSLHITTNQAAKPVTRTIMELSDEIRDI